MNCRICANYYLDTDECRLCDFKLDEEKFFSDKNFDILNMKEEDGWEHLQILDRLHAYNIDCFFADMWFDDDLAYLLGCKGNEDSVSKALGLHTDSVYFDYEHGFVILNLFKEKYIRGILEEKK